MILALSEEIPSMQFIAAEGGAQSSEGVRLRSLVSSSPRMRGARKVPFPKPSSNATLFWSLWRSEFLLELLDRS